MAILLKLPKSPPVLASSEEDASKDRRTAVMILGAFFGALLLLK